MEAGMKLIVIADRKLNDVNPTECGVECCPAYFFRGPTSRRYYLLHYVFSGRGTLWVGDKGYPVSPGQIFIIHPYEMVRYSADPQDPWYYCWVGFELYFDVLELRNNYILTLPEAEPIFEALKDADQKGPQKELFICGKIYELLSLLGQPPAPELSRAEEYVRLAKQYIDFNYPQDITIEKVAEELHISRSYFSTIFRKYMGKSPQQYLVDVRLENAAELISNYGYNVSDAAMSSGYTDIFNFSKMFKRRFGISPSAYAKGKSGPDA